ncbi:uncharacterized protein LOC126825243 [Patella vulgata]|uniref:uncharacterized protein LOC126825243 n=1 Tax=Patella vulgata TaxID=6465 RepID=UPI00217FE67E|nr:uncharacterized protein LOC126825243 [Patella vulgata]
MGGDAVSTRPVSNSREKSLWFPRFRKRGEKILHSKHIVIFVIFLTISDCALVIGELILDLYTVKKSLEKLEERSSRLMDGLESKYPSEFSGDSRMLDIDYVIDRLFHADIQWGAGVDIFQSNVTTDYSARNNTPHNETRHRRYAQRTDDYYIQSAMNRTNETAVRHVYWEKNDHTYAEYVAHCLHYASLSVLSILLIEVSLKILCAGSHFVKRKIEVFDAVIILLSFIVDLIFLKGLSNSAISDPVFILAFLLPWRVIRVVNSLVVAVIDHEHVKLRLLYSRKKKLDKTVDNLRNEVDELKSLLHEVRAFCIKDGMEEWKIDNLLGKFAPRRRKDSKFYSLVKLVMSTASVADDKESVSSGSMDLEINQFARRESVLNEYDGCSTSNENTVTSYNFLSVPNAYDSRSLNSDNDISISSRRSSIDSSSRRSSFNDVNLPVPEFIITNPELNTQIPSDAESIEQQQLLPDKKGSTNQVSPILTRKDLPNSLSPYMSRKNLSNQLSPCTSRKSSNSQLSPCLNRKSSASQLSSCLSRKSSNTQLSPCVSRNSSPTQLSPCLSRKSSTNDISPCLSRNNSATQLTPCLSRNSSASDLSGNCNRERVKRSPHRVNFVLS